MTDPTAPERVWLNTAGCYADAYEATIGSETGVTWCDMPQDDDDQEYVREDLHAAMQAENARLRAALVAIRCIDPQHGQSEWSDGWNELYHRVAQIVDEALAGIAPADLRQSLEAAARAAREGE